MTGAPSENLDAVVRRLRRVRLKLGPAAMRVRDILADDPSWLLTRTSLDVAVRARTSDATVIRTIQALGFTGLPDLKRQIELATRSRLSVADVLGRTVRDLRPGFAGAVAEAAEANRLGLSAIKAGVASGSFGAAIDLIHAARRVVVLGAPPWSGLQAQLRWSLARLGFETLELPLADVARGDLDPAGAAGDLFVALVLPPVSPAASGVLATGWRRGRPLLVISDVPVPDPTADLVSLCVPCGLPGHISLGTPIATLIDTLALGLLACCPDETMKRASGTCSPCSGGAPPISSASPSNP